MLTLIENENQESGKHKLEFAMPAELPSGSYLIVISNASGGKETIKVVK